ncbi:Nif11-like leader peptide family natural product precursor [Acetivibrio cellulolyticus]|uniref:Nif11-like leader peptide family natural product precursor n=1 Tax=Acetivibrio cellulolyticus TaxID=35830 RepID=UPI0001E2D430|nr:Nif11-like leader peptide family natural product precursor [Acetivibrio cellulolyticus]
MVENVLDFYRKAQSDDDLKCELEKISGTDDVEAIINLALQHGFDLCEDDLFEAKNISITVGDGECDAVKLEIKTSCIIQCAGVM